MMIGWVTESGDDNNVHIPLSFRFHTSFMGGLGIGANLNKYSDDDMKESTAWIALYKKLRPVIQNGDLDWLVPPSKVGEMIAVSQTTSKDQQEAVILAFRISSPFSAPMNPVRPRFLKDDVVYRVQIWLQDPHKVAEEYDMSGALLMHKGISLDGLNRAMFTSAVVYLKESYD